MSDMNPSMEDFAALLDESLAAHSIQEGTVVEGTVTAIEKDMAIIDAGLKVEGRVALKEFGSSAKDGGLNVGDTVEVYLERVENAMGEAVLSRDKARREESWVRRGFVEHVGRHHQRACRMPNRPVDQTDDRPK